MQPRFFLSLAACFLFTAAVAPGRADDEDLPSVRSLPCAQTCANSTGAVGVSQPLPPWPEEFLRGDYVEGYVRLNNKINADGHVSDISVVGLVGPQKFADASKSVVKDWVYKPATLNGQPVTTCHDLILTFKAHGPAFGRDEVARTYRRAVDEIIDGKLDDAWTELAQLQAKPNLNLYERGMMANVQALIALKRGDYLESQRLTVLALSFGSEDLPAEVRRSLWETRAKASLGLGDLVDAGLSAYRLYTTRGYDADSPTLKLVENVGRKIDGMPAVGIEGKIPDGVDVSTIGLYRRNFLFQNIHGSLTGFTLNCKQQAVESRISDSAEWHVPKDWSACFVVVRGTPGTTFKLIQSST